MLLCVMLQMIPYSELTIVEEIAGGRFGVVHLAEHLHWKTVAYKELRIPPTSAREKFVYYYAVYCCTILFAAFSTMFLSLGRLLRVDLITLGGSEMSVGSYVRTYIRPSTKSFSDFNEIRYVDRGR